jgi:hypothetical protein
MVRGYIVGPVVLPIYLSHVEEQADYGVTAYLRAMAALKKARPPEAPAEFWLQMQLFVNCSANVSKLLWGQKRKFEAERADLRTAVGVDDSSPLMDTLMRHHFEHFDERIQRWADTRGPGIHLYADKFIGTIDIIPAEPVPTKPDDFFRFYDPETGDLSFWGDHFSVHQIGQELTRIRDTANRELRAWRDRRG